MNIFTKRPATILLSHLDNQLTDFSQHSRSARTATRGSVIFMRDQLTMPLQKGF